MTKEERKKRALEYIKSNKKHHKETSYGPDCQVYNDYSDVVTIHDAEFAIKIALGEIKW